MNTTSLIARLTQDPELKELSGDKQVCRMRVAYNRPGAEDRGAAYFDVEVWGKQAATCQKYLAKGRQVAVSGYLEHNEWETDGTRRQKVYLVARNVEFLDAPQGTDEPSDVSADTDGEEIAF